MAEIRGSQSLAPEGSDLGLGGCRFQQLMSLSLGQTAAGQKPGGTKLGGKGCRGHTGQPPTVCWAVSQPRVTPSRQWAAPSGDSISMVTGSNQSDPEAKSLPAGSVPGTE